MDGYTIVPVTTGSAVVATNSSLETIKEKCFWIFAKAKGEIAISEVYSVFSFYVLKVHAIPKLTVLFTWPRSFESA